MEKITDINTSNYKVTKFKEGDRIISNVGFHDEDINNLIKEKVSDCIGIHVRRGRESNLIYLFLKLY